MALTKLPDEVQGLLDIRDVSLTEEKEFSEHLGAKSTIAFSSWTATFEGTVYLRVHRFDNGPDLCISRSASSALEALEELTDAIHKQNWEFKGA